MTNMKIGVKIGLSFGLILIMLIILSVVTFENVNQMEQDAQKVIRTQELLSNLYEFSGYLTDAETGQRGYMITGNESYLEPYKHAVNHVESHLKELRKQLKGQAEQQSFLDELERLARAKMADMELTIRLLETEGIEKARDKVSQGNGKQLMDEIRSVFEKITANEEDHLQENYIETQSITARTHTALYWICGISFLIVILLTVYFIQTIARPLQKISAIAIKIAAGDLTEVFEETERGDEVGLLITSLTEMTQVMQKQFKAVREGINVLSSSTSEIMSGVSQLAASAEQTATAIGETTTTIEQVKQTAEVSSQKAKEVSADSKKNAMISEEGNKAIAETTESMSIIKQKMDMIAAVVVNLSEQSYIIGEITATVSDLAEQSNILAVNAAIEAAKAGEQGRGFTVVAQEIKNLSNRSKEATAEVRRILNDVQKSITKVVMSTDDGGRVVDKGQELIKATQEAIELLSESIIRAAQASIQIASSSQQQLVGMDQVVMAMENIRESSSQIATTTHQTNISVNDLHQLGERLQDMINFYKVRS